MQIVFNIEKKHLYLFLLIMVCIGFVIVRASFTPDEFGHKYEELNLTGKITANDMEKDAATGFVKLSVLNAAMLNNKREHELGVDQGKCVLAITTCNNAPFRGCPPGYGDGFDNMITGGFQFSGLGKNWDGSVCNSNGGSYMALCCKIN